MVVRVDLREEEDSAHAEAELAPSVHGLVWGESRAQTGSGCKHRTPVISQHSLLLCPFLKLLYPSLSNFDARFLTPLFPKLPQLFRRFSGVKLGPLRCLKGDGREPGVHTRRVVGRFHPQKSSCRLSKLLGGCETEEETHGSAQTAVQLRCFGKVGARQTHVGT